MGLSWDVKPDLLSVKPALLAEKKKGGVPVLVSESLILNPSLSLTLRLCLSIHAQSFDPLGFVLPVRMIGNILFRKTLQFLKFSQAGAGSTKIPWDMLIENVDAEHRFYDSWISYFQMLTTLKDIFFYRSCKPKSFDPNVKPSLITFCDGNEDAFGVVVYALWTLQDGSKEARFLLAKAKLGPLLSKGEVVKNELSGAVLAARARCWIMSQTGIEFSRSYHFLDSRIVQDMMLKESYGFNTFAGLRVAEIQRKTDLTHWLHIPSSENSADILTKGASPYEIGPNSLYQTGPKWLVEDESLWPVTTRAPLSGEQLDTLKRFEKVVKPTVPLKLFKPVVSKPGQALDVNDDNNSSLDVHSQVSLIAVVKEDSTHGFDQLMMRCSSLRKLINSTVYVLRLLGRIYTKRVSFKNVNVRSVNEVIAIDASEYNDAWNFLIHWEQLQRLDKSKHEGLVPVTVEFKLTICPILVSQALLGGRLSNFPDGYGQGQVPIIPYGRFGMLIVQYYPEKSKMNF